MNSAGDRQSSYRAGEFGRRFIPLAGVLVTVLLPILALSTTSFFSYFDNKLYDEFLAKRPAGKRSEKIVIVDIDEKSLGGHGQWPWPRYKIGAIIQALDEAGAAAIGIDIIFPEKDRSSLVNLRRRLLSDLDVKLDYNGEQVIEDNDAYLATVIDGSPTVLGYQFSFSPILSARTCHLHPLQLTGGEGSVSPRHFPLQANYAICNLERLAISSAGSGFLNTAPDADGIVRRANMIVAYGGSFYPSLGLALAMEVSGADYASLTSDFDDLMLRFGNTALPLTSRGTMLINYREEGASYASFSAADLLAGDIASDSLKDKIVLVGTTAAGLKELRSTPFDPLFPGVEVHATILDNLLTGDILRRPSSALAIELLAAFGCGFLYLLLTRRGGAWRSLLVFGGLAILLFFSSFQLFSSKGLYLSPVLPLFTLAGNFSLLSLFRYRLKEIEATRQVKELAQAQAAIIEGMASLTESRHRETGRHIHRTQEYVRILAELVKEKDVLTPPLTDDFIETLYRTAPLHDIGKVGISDTILLKEGPLTPAEFEEIKKHTVIGRDILISIRSRLGDLAFLRMALDLVSAHHEKWDGTGYPEGLSGERIPLAGRIMAIVDMYDALTSKRVYKEIFTHDEAIDTMAEHAGTSFDPTIFAVFLENHQLFRQASQRLADG